MRAGPGVLTANLLPRTLSEFDVSPTESVTRFAPAGIRPSSVAAPFCSMTELLASHLMSLIATENVTVPEPVPANAALNAGRPLAADSFF